MEDKRLHHEIYLSDARKVAPEKLKTVIRHPIKKGTNSNEGIYEKQSISIALRS